MRGLKGFMSISSGTGCINLFVLLKRFFARQTLRHLRNVALKYAQVPTSKSSEKCTSSGMRLNT